MSNTLRNPGRQWDRFMSEVTKFAVSLACRSTGVSSVTLKRLVYDRFPQVLRLEKLFQSDLSLQALEWLEEMGLVVLCVDMHSTGQLPSERYVVSPVLDGFLPRHKASPRSLAVRKWFMNWPKGHLE